MSLLFKKSKWSYLKKKVPSAFLIKSLILCMNLFFVQIANAQTSKTITGKIVNENGEILPNVSVKVKNTTKGVATDSKGNFTLNVAEGTTIEVSSVSYETKEFVVSTLNEYNISLKSSTQTQNTVIVVGYGSQKRATVTGAISSVSSKTLNELPVASIDQALQGRVSGLTVTNNGSPGSAPIIAIRGISSITGGLAPLYVIDGFPTGSLNTFDTRDVESVEVLKDASAAAIYGSRATNGVVLITTKKGRRNGKVQITYDNFVGLQSPAKKISLMNTQQYVQFATSLLGASNLPPRLLPANFNKPIHSQTTQTFAQTNTDWQDEYFVKNAFITQHSVSASTGNEVSRLFTSAGYFNQKGIAQGLGYLRGNFRVNSDHIISKTFTFGQTLYLATADQRPDGSGGGNRTPLANVIRMQPYLPVRNPDNNGGFNGPISSFDGSDPTNPVEPALLQDVHNKQNKILGTAYVDVNITSWLKFKSSYGLDYSNNLSSQYTPIFNDGGTLSAPLATIALQRSIFTTQLFTQQLSFNKTFGKHTVGATAVFETQDQTGLFENQSGNQDNNTIRTLNGASNPSNNFTKGDWFLQSYIGRVNYDYNNKYLISASIRRDGLSIWAPGNKFQNFPSVSAGWRIDQESFMKSIPAISELKLRAGYGLTGLDGVSFLGNYPWQVGVNVNNTLYPFGGNTSGGLGSSYGSLPNKSLKWETTTQTNIGFDLGLFKNKITLIAEYYKRQSDNVIIGVPTPLSFGFGGGGVNANVADLQNTGFDFQLGYNKNNGSFKYNVTGLISFVKNRINRLDTDNASIVAGADPDFSNGAEITKTEAGQPVQYFFGFLTDGLFQSAGEIARSATQTGAAVGDIKFKDLNNDGKITDADRTNLGSYIPKFTYSTNFTASYKNFDATLYFQGSYGNKIFNGIRVLSEGMRRLFNGSTEVLNAWTPSNTNTNIPRAINGDPNGNARVSDRWIENGSYLRLKNLMFGYTIKDDGLKKLTKGVVTRFRIYVSSQNLFTVTKYTGWDPEIGSRNGALTNGIDYGQYPSARSFQVGLQVGF